MAVVLLSSVAVRALAADPAPQPQPVGETHGAEASVSPLAAQALERLSATRERPLFSPSRRPPAPPPALPSAPPPPPAPPDVALLAVVMDGEQARAIIRTGPKIMRVQIGDDIDGWKVGQIEARQLVLSLNERTAKFAMFTGNRANGAGDAGAAMRSPSAPPGNLAQQSSAPSGDAAPPTTAYTHPKRPHRE
jgi:general secretion pathway protein N